MVQKQRSQREVSNEALCLGGHLQFTTDTSTAAQRGRVLNRLKREAVDTITLRTEENVMMPAARIKELRVLGNDIATIRINRHDDQGRLHRNVALYTLKLAGSG